MKTIKKIQLKNVAKISNDEMKFLYGGFGSRNSDECSAPQEQCDTSKTCKIGGGPESGVCVFSGGAGCHCGYPSEAGGSGTSSGVTSGLLYL